MNELWLFLILLTLIALAWIVIPTIRLKQQLQKASLNTSAWITNSFLIIISLILPFTAFYYYNKLGASQQLKAWYTLRDNQQAVKQLLTELKTPAQVINKMQTYLTQHPNDARGWFLLGRLFFSAQDFGDAETAFASAYRINPHDRNTMLQYAQASYFAHQQELTSLSVTLLQNIIKHDPQNNGALTILAMDAYHHQDYQRAIVIWEELLAQSPEGSPDQQILLDAIARAQKALATDKH